MLTVSDITAALAFYQKAFGFTKRSADLCRVGTNSSPCHSSLGGDSPPEQSNLSPVLAEGVQREKASLSFSRVRPIDVPDSSGSERAEKGQPEARQYQVREPYGDRDRLLAERRRGW